MELELQLIYFLGAVVIIMSAALLVQNTVLFNRTINFLDTATATFGDIAGAVYKKAPEPVQQVGGHLETITDIAKQWSVERFGTVDESKITQFAATIESVFDIVVGQGETEPDGPTLEDIEPKAADVEWPKVDPDEPKG